MASTLYYDSVGYYSTATFDDGTTAIDESGATYSNAGDTISFEDRLYNENITDAATNIANTDSFRISLASAQDVDFVAVYFTAQDTDNLFLHQHTSNTGGLTQATLLSATFDIGWTVNEFSLVNKQFWFLSAVADIVGLSQMFIGAKLVFPVEPTAKIIERYQFGTESIKAYGNTEFVKSNHDPIRTYELGFNFITTTQKDALLSFQETVTNQMQFIYSENGTTGPFHYVRLIDGMEFIEVAPGIFNTIMILRELQK